MVRPSARARAIITRWVVTALAVASPALVFGQSAPSEGAPSESAPAVAPAQAVSGVGSVGAALPGAVLPGESPTLLGPEPPEYTLYGVAAGIGESDNVNLVTTNPKSATVTAANADFDVKRSGTLFDATALGNFSDLYYVQGGYGNELLGRFDGSADAKLWADRLKWFVADDYGEEQTDPFQTLTPNGLQRVNVFTTGPDLTLRPSYATFVDLSARYSRVTYQRSPFDGHNLLASAEFGRQLSALSSLSFVVQAEELRFDNTTVNTDYDRREAYLHYRVQGARTSIDAQLGMAQADDVNSSWKTSPLARLTLTRRLSPFALLTVAGGREYTDAGGSFSNLQSGAGGGIVVAPVSQTTSNALRDYGSGGVVFERLRTTLGLTADWERDTYDLQPIFDVTRESAGLNLGRSLTPRLEANISASLQRYDYFSEGFTDKFGTVGGGLVYRAARGVVAYVRYDHSFRRAVGTPNGVVGGGDYDENRVFLMVGYRPHSDEAGDEGGAAEGAGGAPSSP
jgi:hypothetical protein